MGNIIVGIILTAFFSGIIYSMVSNYRKKGTICTNCSTCPLIEKCDSDIVTDEIKEFYKTQV